jgi:hypothetical protein
VDVIWRSVAADVTLDGRTVEGVVVPYDVPADVVDEFGPTPGEVCAYREVFVETSFARQLQGIAARPDLLRGITYKLEHTEDIRHRIGYTAAMASTPAGLVARFGLYPTADLDLVRSMLAESHGALSMEAGLVKSRTRPDGVIERRTVVLRAVAAVPAGAYVGAAITAMRADADAEHSTPALDAVRDRWGFTD